MTIELFGIARIRAGCARLAVDASTVAEALIALGEQCPNSVPEIVEHGRLDPHYMASINGGPFQADPEAPLAESDSLIILGNQAGG